jgi:hypothetical protein
MVVVISTEVMKIVGDGNAALAGIIAQEVNQIMQILRKWRPKAFRVGTRLYRG